MFSGVVSEPTRKVAEAGEGERGGAVPAAEGGVGGGGGAVGGAGGGCGGGGGAERRGLERPLPPPPPTPGPPSGPWDHARCSNTGATRQCIHR